MRWGRYGALSVPAVYAGAPWWALLMVGLGGLGAYGLREVLRYRLARQALDKVNKDDVPKVLSIATGGAASEDEAEAVPDEGPLALLRRILGKRSD
ncbi:hypothetical protein GCM10023196_049240 [Actinoallomurus vinaceus]|uniref:Uncharacterized protein n=1 Tax=Actinoallomurus vinaceus TaxID=1080074 RepID=A0ABP8UEH5_9ACTN